MIAAVAVLMAVLVILVNRQGIFQEGNPVPVFSGIWKLMVDKEPYACIKEEPPTYIAGAGKQDGLFAFIEKQYGVEYQSNSGGIYIFTGGGKTVKLSMRHYTRSFRVWEIVDRASP
jgi:hypothetical protein